MEENMKKSIDDMEEFQDAAKPLVDWLRKNGCPHDQVIVNQINAEMVRGEMSVNFYEGVPKK